MGPDSALWFTDQNNRVTGSIGRITTAGIVSNYRAPSIKFPTQIALGADSAMWFTNAGRDSIGRITAIPASVMVSPTAGPKGTRLTISGAGFTSGETVNVDYNTGLPAPSPASVVLCTSTVRSIGTFACSGTIPKKASGATGAHTIEAKGATSLAEA